MDNAELLDDFLTECNENLEQIDNDLVHLEQNPSDLDVIKKIFRSIHTVKGASGMFGLSRLEKVAHAAEDVLNKMRDGGIAPSSQNIDPILKAVDIIKGILAHLGEHKEEPEGDDSLVIRALVAVLSGEATNLENATPPASSESLETAEGASSPSARSAAQKTKSAPAETTLRVHVDVLDRLMNLVGELVLNRNQLVQLIRGVDESEFHNPINQLDRVTSSLQESVMKTRMQPIGVAWGKLPRIVRDLSANSGKKLNLIMEGQDTEVDRQILQAIQDPLLHCVRNSADHGIENPQQRAAASKNPEGNICLRAYHEGGLIVVEVQDDGKGIDAEVIRRKAVERGLVSSEAAAHLAPAEVLRFIFEAGFSTAQEVTEVSGRGVGMDVVKSNVEKIGGNVDIFSEVGKGTTIRITIPLTLAIISALIVRVGDDPLDVFALPQSSVLELVRITPDNSDSIERVENSKFLRLRDSLLPLIDLRKILELGDSDNLSDAGEFSIVVCQIGDSRFGLIAREIFDTQEVVVKAPGHYLKEIQVYAGATILGDGRVILILDIGRISEMGLSAVANSTDQTTAGADEIKKLENSDKTQLLLIRSTKNNPMAIPLALVSRLEEFDSSRFERADGKNFVQYRGALLQVLSVDDTWMPPSEGVVPAIIFSDGEKSMGLAVNKIKDIVAANLSVESSGKSQGVLGAAIVDGEVTEVVDVYSYLLKAFPDWFANRKLGATKQKKKILLVEDSPFFRDMIRPVLESQNYFVKTACDGAEGLKILSSDENFDLVLTDIEMPNKDGWDLMRDIRSTQRFDNLPVVAMTTLNDESSRAKAVDLGFTKYLIKFDQDELLSAIEEKIL